MARTEPGDIDLLIMDVDGVLTDGRIIYDDAGRELKAFCVQDGAGLKYWKRAGKKSAIITGRESGVVIRRASELDIDLVHQGALDKLPALREILRDLDVPAERTAYIGDDLPDIPPMRACGLAIAVANAVPEVKQIADIVTLCHGGQGAVREAICMLLQAGGLWEKILQRYQ